jgi:hypothetical protein
MFSNSCRCFLTLSKYKSNFFDMSRQSVLDKFDQLPPKAQKEADDFVQFLYDRYVKSRSKKSSEKPISESSFIGMWKDRDDMSDSTKWVRQQRKTQWTKS